MVFEKQIENTVYFGKDYCQKKSKGGSISLWKTISSNEEWDYKEQYTCQVCYVWGLGLYWAVDQ